MASSRRSEPDQLRITHNVYELLVKAKKERNEWQARCEQMERERDEWASRCQQLVEAVEALQQGNG